MKDDSLVVDDASPLKTPGMLNDSINLPDYYELSKNSINSVINSKQAKAGNKINIKTSY